MQSWVRMGDKLSELAAEDEARGRLLSAGEKLGRASIYYLTAERLQAHGAEGRAALYRKVLAAFARSLELSRANAERVEIPYAKARIAGWLIHAPKTCSGRDAAARADQRSRQHEGDALSRWIADMARTARRRLSRHRPARHRRSVAAARHARRLRQRIWASKVVDWLETRNDVDPRRIGLQGVSLGGYYCPRAVAFEPRFACGVVWGANHDWRDVQKRRLAREGAFPVPHYWEHVRWVWGAKDMDDFMRIAETRAPGRRRSTASRFRSS